MLTLVSHVHFNLYNTIRKHVYSELAIVDFNRFSTSKVPHPCAYALMCGVLISC
jgi:hypothetical protein